MKSQEPVQPEIRKLLEDTYFSEFDEDEFIGPLAERLSRVQEPFVQCGNAFRNNLEALIAVVSLPILLASDTVTEMRFQQLLMAERIRRIPIEPNIGHPGDKNLSREDEQEAYRVAHDKLHEELATTNGIAQASLRAWGFLYAGLRSRSVSSAARELLRQSAVLCWGALEVLARDIFVLYINANPGAASGLLDHPSTKGRFDVKGISIDVLASHGFDLSTRMGDVLLQHQDLAELGAIKDVYQVLFPDARALHLALGARGLWLLNQRRHLIVHKRGIVDARYLGRTGDKAQLGAVLNILPSELKDYLKLVRDAGLEILGVVSPEDASSTYNSDEAANV